ncbi:MAG: YbfB/YjiJ family MFS transporter [Bacillota bacterium]
MGPKPAGSGVDPGRKSGLHYGYVILAVGFLVVTGALGFARFGYATILPSMKVGLSLSNTQMGLIASGNLIGYASFSLIGGFLAARFGPRLVIGGSMLLAGATMFLTGTAGGFGQAVALRFLTGLGSAGSNVPVMGLVSAWFAPRRRGMAAGILVGGSGMGFLVTGFLVPRLVAAWPGEGWRLSWFALGGAVFLIGLLAALFLRNRPSEKGLASIGEFPAVPSPPPRTPVAGANEGPGAGTGNSRPHASGDGRTVSWGSVYASPALWHLGTVYLFFGFSYIIYGTFFCEAMVADKGFSQSQAGAVWSLVGLMGIFSGILWGSASDHIGRRPALAAIFALQAFCYFLFATAHTSQVLYLSAVLFGLTAFSIPGVVAAACGDYVGPRLAPAALGMVTLFFAVGQALAPAVAGLMADLTSTLSHAFLLAAAVAALGAAGSLTLRPPGAQIDRHPG